MKFIDKLSAAHIAVLVALAIAIVLTALCLILAAPARAQVPRAQIFNSHMADPSALPNVKFVWGAKAPLFKADVVDSFYYPNQRDYNRSHTIEWFKASHPDWVAYECDQKTPAYGYVYDWGAYVPIDTTNMEVRQYILDTYIKPALARGYKAVAFDNVSLRNYDKRCGVWRGGKWVQLFTGASIDMAHTTEKLNYIGWMAQAIHSLGGKVALNAKVDPQQPTMTQDLVRLSDIWLDESGFADHCNDKVVGALWWQKMDLIRHVTVARSYASVNYSCESRSADMPSTELQWVLASWLITRPANASLAVLSKDETGEWIDNPKQELNPLIGKPTAPTMSQGDVFFRFYGGNIVVANVSGSAPGEFDLPSGTFRDLDGKAYTGTISLPPRSGLVLFGAN